jgi:hypothetical protein
MRAGSSRIAIYVNIQTFEADAVPRNPRSPMLCLQYPRQRLQVKAAADSPLSTAGSMFEAYDSLAAQTLRKAEQSGKPK